MGYTKKADRKVNKDIINHVHRIQGQLAGVERMIEKCLTCDDVVMQLMAARSSIERITLKLIEDETEACLKNKKDITHLKAVAATLFKYT